MRFHINDAGDVHKCEATVRECRFGGADAHYTSEASARAAYENSSGYLEEEALTWPPMGLPKKLHEAATAADLIRHFNDSHFDGGAGSCLAASAFVSNRMLNSGVPHKLVRGSYIDENGDKHAHWWLQASGWIIDPSRGQFHEERYRSGVVRANKSSYSTELEYEPGHTTDQLVEAEVKRSFGDENEAEWYLGQLQELHDEASGLMASEHSMR